MNHRYELLLQDSQDLKYTQVNFDRINITVNKLIIIAMHILLNIAQSNIDYMYKLAVH